MTILVDTNILLRMAEPAHSQQKIAHQSTQALLARAEKLIIVPQILYEFWVAATRPIAQNGLGWTSIVADAELAKAQNIFELIDETPSVLTQWRGLVTQQNVLGKSAHDAHVVAAMIVHGISTILTFNKADFLRYSTVNAITPDEVLASTHHP